MEGEAKQEACVLMYAALSDANFDAVLAKLGDAERDAVRQKVGLAAPAAARRTAGEARRGNSGAAGQVSWMKKIARRLRRR